MAFVNSEMALVDYTANNKLFSYANSAGDNNTAITTAGYFDAGLVPQNLKVGDIILVKSSGELYRISAIASGVVTAVTTT